MPTASHTRRKLDEAKYFCNNLWNLTSRPDSPGLPEVAYNLSASISAGRSVLWVMRSEYLGVNGWEEWYDSKRPSEEDQKLLKHINDLRTDTVKKKALSPEFRFLVWPYLTQNQAGELVHSEVTILPGPSEAQPISVQGGDLTWALHLDGRDVTDSCGEYLEFLTELVNECEQLFGIPS